MCLVCYRLPKKTKPTVQKDTCTPVFIAALFTIARTWKQSKSPSTDKDIVHIYSGMLLGHKKE